MEDLTARCCSEPLKLSKGKAIVVSLRPRQWTKNLILFAGIIFSKNLLVGHQFIKTLLAFLLFCLISGSGYIINDLIDLDNDRRHPRKCRRPLACGSLKPSDAVIAAVITGTISLALSFFLNKSFGLIATCYLFLVFIYSLFLKKVLIIGVFAIALGFVLRALAGTVVIGVEISSWLLVCTTFLALFLALAKRRQQIFVGSPNQQAEQVQKSPHSLDMMIAVVSACAIIAYSLYIMSEETVTRFNTTNLKFTIPFVIYGVFRYIYLVYKKHMGGSPEEVLLTDRPLTVSVSLWIITVIMIIYLRV